MLGRKHQKKPRKLSNEEFDLIYEAIRGSTTHPSTKPVSGSEFGTKSYREQ